jgi:hypothetical protein
MPIFVWFEGGVKAVAKIWDEVATAKDEIQDKMTKMAWQSEKARNTSDRKGKVRGWI